MRTVQHLDEAENISTGDDPTPGQGRKHYNWGWPNTWTRQRTSQLGMTQHLDMAEKHYNWDDPTPGQGREHYSWGWPNTWTKQKTLQLGMAQHLDKAKNISTGDDPTPGQDKKHYSWGWPNTWTGQRTLQLGMTQHLVNRTQTPQLTRHGIWQAKKAKLWTIPVPMKKCHQLTLISYPRPKNSPFLLCLPDQQGEDITSQLHSVPN